MFYNPAPSWSTLAAFYDDAGPSEPVSLAAPPPRTPDVLWALARTYYVRAERYDRTVCTGPLSDSDGILPATPRELGRVNRNALVLLREAQDSAKAAGFSSGELRGTMRKYVESHEHAHDMRNLDAVVL